MIAPSAFQQRKPPRGAMVRSLQSAIFGSGIPRNGFPTFNETTPGADHPTHDFPPQPALSRLVHLKITTP
jgi:hypothetical protein